MVVLRSLLRKCLQQCQPRFAVRFVGMHAAWVWDEQMLRRLCPMSLRLPQPWPQAVFLHEEVRSRGV